MVALLGSCPRAGEGRGWRSLRGGRRETARRSEETQGMWTQSQEVWLVWWRDGMVSPEGFCLLGQIRNSSSAEDEEGASDPHLLLSVNP